MASLFQVLGCCCNRPRQHELYQWEDNLRLHSDEEDADQDTQVIMPMYTLDRPQVQAAVRLDLASAGQYAVIVKNSTRLCGSGAARASVPIVQDKAYFEVKIQAAGLWAVGLCHSKVRCAIYFDLGRMYQKWLLYP